MPREAGTGFYIHFKDPNITSRAWCGGGLSGCWESSPGADWVSCLGSFLTTAPMISKPTTLIIKQFYECLPAISHFGVRHKEAMVREDSRQPRLE